MKDWETIMWKEPIIIIGSLGIILTGLILGFGLTEYNRYDAWCYSKGGIPKHGRMISLCFKPDALIEE